jgi:hypothetical protein
MFPDIGNKKTNPKQREQQKTKEDVNGFVVIAIDGFHSTVRKLLESRG